jgi:two-component system, chemotaxis family, protein-glutamate methylesterase/glutaminase
MMRARENKKIKVLVVDDSVLMSRQISNILASAGGIEVVGRAKDGLEALTMVNELKPDVVTMDVEMPRMNGITALKHIMVRNAVPIIMISALTTDGARTTFDAFKYGAIDVVAKPSRRDDTNLEVQKADIIAKVKRAARVSPGRLRYIRVNNVVEQPRQPLGAPDESTRFIALGAGTGGHYALLRVLPGLPAGFQGVVIIVILMSRRYLDPFVVFLASHCAVPVTVASHGVPVERGVAYICSGHEGLILNKRTNGRLEFKKTATEEECAMGKEGSINLMFKSVANVAGRQGVGVVMSGPGRDGAEGLAEIRRNGGINVVQEINNCMDPSMPLAALEKGFVERILPDYHMADFFANLV